MASLLRNIWKLGRRNSKRPPRSRSHSPRELLNKGKQKLHILDTPSPSPASGPRSTQNSPPLPNITALGWPKDGRYDGEDVYWNSVLTDDDEDDEDAESSRDGARKNFSGRWDGRVRLGERSQTSRTEGHNQVTRQRARSLWMETVEEEDEGEGAVLVTSIEHVDIEHQDTTHSFESFILQEPNRILSASPSPISEKIEYFETGGPVEHLVSGDVESSSHTASTTPEEHIPQHHYRQYDQSEYHAIPYPPPHRHTSIPRKPLPGQTWSSALELILAPTRLDPELMRAVQDRIDTSQLEEQTLSAVGMGFVPNFSRPLGWSAFYAREEGGSGVRERVNSVGGDL